MLGRKVVYLCYLDESGTPEITGNTSHYVLAGVSIPVEHWKTSDAKIEKIKSKYSLENKEIHVAWMLRSYPEQGKISDFEALTYSRRRSEVISFRASELLKLQRNNNLKLYKQTKKNYQKTAEYIHLTQKEREKLIYEIASEVSAWWFVRLFAECIDKPFYVRLKTATTIEVQAFEQVVSRFEHYLQLTNHNGDERRGLLIHDNNETVAKKHTLLMKKFHSAGTLWTKLKYIIETPLFVNSELTTMVQISDLCAYSLRRYLENGETTLFNLIFKRADRMGDASSSVVGVRHFCDPKAACTCTICTSRTPANKVSGLTRSNKIVQGGDMAE